jgi:hypothetical protein
LTLSLFAAIKNKKLIFQIYLCFLTSDKLSLQNPNNKSASL